MISIVNQGKEQALRWYEWIMKYVRKYEYFRSMILRMYWIQIDRMPSKKKSIKPRMKLILPIRVKTTT